MKNSLKITAYLCAGIMTLAAATIASSADTSATGQTTVSAQSDSKPAKAKNVTYGKVTAVNGSAITLALGEFSAKQDDSTKKPERNDPTGQKEKPSLKDNNTTEQKEKPSKPEKKSSESTESSENSDKKPDGKRGGKHGRKDGEHGEFTENGSTLTVTLDDNNTLGRKGQAVSA